MAPRVLWLVLACASCRSAVDDVTYHCVPVTRYPYVESFGDSLDRVRDRCWETHDAENAVVLTDESDLVIRLDSPALWSADTRAPSVTRRVEGDFVIVARAEPVNTQASDHCDLGETETAGLVARGVAEGADWITLAVRPQLDPANPRHCEDELAPPRAIVSLKTRGLAADAAAPPPLMDQGADGEADVALCRIGTTLQAYVRQVDATGATQGWPRVSDPLRVASEPMEIGVTTTRGDVGAVSMEGHFNWIVLQQVGTLLADGCARALEAFQVPEEE